MLGRMRKVLGSKGCRYLGISSFIFQKMRENLQLPLITFRTLIWLYHFFMNALSLFIDFYKFQNQSSVCVVNTHFFLNKCVIHLKAIYLFVLLYFKSVL